LNSPPLIANDTKQHLLQYTMVSHDEPITAPESKTDLAAVERLNNLPPSSWQHLIPDLLCSLQDANWPIFMDVTNLPLKCPHNLIGPLRTVFEGDDDTWQSWTLEHLIRRLPEDCLNELKPMLLEFYDRVPPGVDADWDMKAEVDEVLGLIGPRHQVPQTSLEQGQ